MVPAPPSTYVSPLGTALGGELAAPPIVESSAGPVGGYSVTPEKEPETNAP